MNDPFRAVGKGVVAGLAGTAAITASMLLESRLRHRDPSTAPAQAAEKVLSVEPADEAAEARLANVVHWSYGTLWGVPRGLLAVAGLGGPAAAAAHFAAVWGAALGTLPALRIAPPPWKRGPGELAIDALHHAVYAAAAGMAYEALSRAWPDDP